ncbi:hypothetical protein [Desulfovibrio aminophilus]|jgi:hypothetical protein|uniref:VgrG-related protein n=1 Tax=Desulfovibrio aminophilus TaxID=81425 RepID=UPI00040B8273|nr:hypothetical protein [Desulfovibrio aminophilus]MDY0305723.1 hypothetical protein [Desulfovibrionaceae bacterium]
MAYDTNSLGGVRALNEAEKMLNGGGRGRSAEAPALSEARRMAFQTQLAAVRQVADEPGADESERRFSVDPGVLNDSLMLDALRTIARLTRESANDLSRDAGLSAGRGKRGPIAGNGLGGLSARFESGAEGVAAIGYDRVGGTSYGKYQLSSKAGTMGRFIDFLRDKEPQWAARLSQAGPADTGAPQGAMPRAWRQIAQENPTRFEQLQHDFVRNEHYLPARERILETTGVDIDAGPAALREVLWSTSVQHGAGGAARIFSRVISDVLDKNGGEAAGRHIIDGIYSDRQKQFSSSTEAVRKSVRNRLREERGLALAMLDSAQVRKIV